MFQPYCAPAFFDRHKIGLPEDLPLKMLISTAQNAVSWDEWLHLQGMDLDERPVGSVQMDPSHLAIRAARDGVGVILESSVLVAQEVSEGKLVPVFPHLTRPGAGYWIYTPSARNLRPSVEAVREWLKSMAADDARS